MSINNFLEGIKIIDGVNMKIKSNRMNFLFLIKSIERNNQKTINIMLTDSADNFWLGDFDEVKIKKIKEQMKLNGSFVEFFTVMKEMLKNKHFEIEIGDELELDLVIEFKFSGIVLNSRFNIGKPFKRDDNPTISYNLLKVFVLDLYNAYEKERDNLEQQNSEFKQQVEKVNNQIKEGLLIQSNNIKNIPSQPNSNHFLENPSNIKKMKPNTCIINPSRRKRKAMGAKIGSSSDENSS